VVNMCLNHQKTPTSIDTVLPAGGLSGGTTAAGRILLDVPPPLAPLATFATGSLPPLARLQGAQSQTGRSLPSGEKQGIFAHCDVRAAKCVIT
jgi:hypothetical protein